MRAMQQNAAKAGQLAGALSVTHPNIETRHCGNHCVRVRRADGNAVSISLMGMPMGCGWETLPLIKGDGPITSWGVMASGDPAHVMGEDATIPEVVAALENTLTGEWNLKDWSL